MLTEAVSLCLTQAVATSSSDNAGEGESKVIKFPTNSMFYKTYDLSDALPTEDDFGTEKLVLAALLTYLLVPFIYNELQLIDSNANGC